MAIAAYAEAARFDPKGTKAFNKRGLAYGRKGESGKVEVDFAEAKKLWFSPERKAK